MIHRTSDPTRACPYQQWEITLGTGRDVFTPLRNTSQVEYSDSMQK